MHVIWNTNFFNSKTNKGEQVKKIALYHIFCRKYKSSQWDERKTEDLLANPTWVVFESWSGTSRVSIFIHTYHHILILCPRATVSRETHILAIVSASGATELLLQCRHSQNLWQQHYLSDKRTRDALGGGVMSCRVVVLDYIGLQWCWYCVHACM